MTRINCVPVSTLCRQHLLAEYRELPRVFTLARNWFRRVAAAGEEGSYCDIPETYRLGKGHVQFFYNKLGFLRRRHKELCDEMMSRGYLVTIDCSVACEDLPEDFQQDWDPPQEAIDLNEQRIQERLTEMAVKDKLRRSGS